MRIKSHAHGCKVQQFVDQRRSDVRRKSAIRIGSAYVSNGSKLTFAIARMLHRTFPKAAGGLNYDL